MRVGDPGRGWTRREALAGSAALALSGCARRIATPELLPAEAKDVVIVGGGMAGLHCAYRLRRRGVAATVYEAAPRLGGRMFTDRSTFPDGQHCELGGELIDTSHRTMLDLADELGIEMLDYTKDDASLDRFVAYIDGRRIGLDEMVKLAAPIGRHLAQALAALSDPDAPITYRNPNGCAALDRLSVRGWFDSVGVPEGDPARRLLELAYGAELGLDAGEASALGMLLVVRADERAFEIFGDSDERFHAAGGNDSFIQALVARLAPEQIVRGHRLVALRRLSDGRLLATFDAGGKTVEVKASHVVLAIPFTMLREVKLDVDLPEPKRRAIAELAYGTNAKLMTGYGRRVWREKHHSNGTTFADVGYQLSWETSRLQPGDAGIITNFVGGAAGIALGQGSAADRASDFLTGFERVFPTVREAFNGHVARMHWPSYPLTRGSYSAYRVGQYTGIAGAEIERVGNLHFCGEHTSLDAQGFMEGAALTGAMAAAEVAEALGAPAVESFGPGARIASRAEVSRRLGSWMRVLPRRSAG